MNVDWKLKKDQVQAVGKGVAGLSLKDRRALLKQLKEMPEDECANVYFPAFGLFGCDVILGHILYKTITDATGTKGEDENPDDVPC